MFRMSPLVVLALFGFIQPGFAEDIEKRCKRAYGGYGWGTECRAAGSDNIEWIWQKDLSDPANDVKRYANGGSHNIEWIRQKDLSDPADDVVKNGGRFWGKRYADILEDESDYIEWIWQKDLADPTDDVVKNRGRFWGKRYADVRGIKRSGCVNHDDDMMSYFGVNCDMVGSSNCNKETVQTFCPVMCGTCADCWFCDQSQLNAWNIPPSCGVGEYNCLGDTSACYDKLFKCSGYPECRDGTDEMFC